MSNSSMIITPPTTLAVTLVLALPVFSEEPTTSTITGNIFRPVQLTATDERIAGLKIADGFKLSVFARDLDKPRMMAADSQGRVYVTRRGEKGDILLLEDPDKDGAAEAPRKVLELPHVHGIAIKGSTVFLATIREVYSAPLSDDGGIGQLKLLYEGLPDAGQHPNRTLDFSPDGELFLSVGSAANAAAEPNKESATMLWIDLEGKTRDIFASGLRNTIGFDWHPVTGKFYGMDHGIDYLGDDAQKEELNELKKGKKYGWPFVYEDGKANLEDDPKETTGMNWDEYAELCEPSVLTATAHSAPMALLFPSATNFPKAFHGDALVTFHGSWNRSKPSGYSVMRLRFKDGAPDKFEDFLTGFVRGDGQFGRPCGLLELKDG
ncbi:PQQ-dependent sugar dehydrogenase [Luteolibacter sp. GHJ8]|uniref:PQQ-dependent sugar dehydrogenase n=1 Tax=Luteolibacter rhizosphaerae TaxID=2989719 RepID=A0ABT3G8R2_9BACT|nr:PQQ-dependent sugar dehydrogenase [Luteolibacter rhizosphaerae]MCW1915854.1 PQQ-dependent sugar dehydrogenase [Luteolibacter rhizosphaerae]